MKKPTDEWVEVAELQSTQEEADTRLLLHALHAARTGSMAAIVTAEDTDVMLPCCAFQKDTPCPIYQKCGICRHQKNWPGNWETASVTA